MVAPSAGLSSLMVLLGWGAVGHPIQGCSPGSCAPSVPFLYARRMGKAGSVRMIGHG